MKIILDFVLLIVGFILLIKGADKMVDGSASIAKKLGLSTMMIGLTVVAFGTSAPELIVNIFSSIEGSSDIGMGNIIGSNISNILLILGVSAIIVDLEVNSSIIKKQIPFSILSVVALFVLINGEMFNSGINGLNQAGGLILMLFFSIFLYYTISIARENRHDIKKAQLEKVEEVKTSLSLLYIIGGIIALFVGGKLIVDSASDIARFLGLSEVFIGLTIVALGTSLPELAASLVAAKKKHTDMAIGNVIGSNIFNILWVLALSAIIRPIEFNPIINFDIIFLIIASVVLFPLIFIGKKYSISRREGIILVALYIFYISYISIRG